MHKLLKNISRAALQLNDGDFSDQQRQEDWLGYPKAEMAAITQAEERLGVVFPEDYRQLLQLTDGFAAATFVEPQFLAVAAVDFLKNIDPELINIWRETGNEALADTLTQSILVAGKDEEQQFLLIPPSAKNDTWQYWKFAAWIPGEEAYEGLEKYLEYVLEFLQEELAA